LPITSGKVGTISKKKTKNGAEAAKMGSEFKYSKQIYGGHV